MEAATRQTSFIGYFLRDEQVERYSARSHGTHLAPLVFVGYNVSGPRWFLLWGKRNYRAPIGCRKFHIEPPNSLVRSSIPFFIERSFSYIVESRCQDSAEKSLNIVSSVGVWGRFRDPCDTGSRLALLKFIRWKLERSCWNW